MFDPPEDFTEYADQHTSEQRLEGHQLNLLAQYHARLVNFLDRQKSLKEGNVDRAHEPGFATGVPDHRPGPPLKWSSHFPFACFIY